MLQIRLAEPVVFLRQSSDMTASGRHRATNAEAPPVVLRGILTLSLSKPTKIKSIEVNFSGLVKTEWPEGLCSPSVIFTVIDVCISRQVLAPAEYK